MTLNIKKSHENSVLHMGCWIDFLEIWGIGALNLNLEKYAIVLAGIETSGILFIFIAEESVKQGKG